MHSSEQQALQKIHREGDHNQSSSNDMQRGSSNVIRNSEQHITQHKSEESLADLINDRTALWAKLARKDRSNRAGLYKADEFGRHDLLAPLQEIETPKENTIEGPANHKSAEIPPKIPETLPENRSNRAARRAAEFGRPDVLAYLQTIETPKENTIEGTRNTKSSEALPVSDTSQAEARVRDDRSLHRMAPESESTSRNDDQPSSFRKVAKKASQDLLAALRGQKKVTERPISFQRVRVEDTEFIMESHDPTTIDRIPPASFSDRNSQKLYNTVYRMFQHKQDGSELVIGMPKVDPTNRENTIIKLNKSLAEQKGIVEASSLKGTAVDYSLPANDWAQIDKFMSKREFQAYTSVDDWETSFE